ncbi:MAG: NAD(P)-binding protein [Verrucomicrobia bacterium]|nr:NAD(P)-binding protein [Verrucomicrobiota bacterium]
MKFHVVGSGISGSAAARLLADAGHHVEIWETRSQTGGNCHDERINGVTVHRYGPHLFHTNDRAVWEFLSRFTAWTDYRHKVMADTALGRISIPYSKVTERQIGHALTDEEIRDLIFAEYSEKQWGVPWKELPAAITGRVPTRRDNDDDRYFTDEFQGQPACGYAAMFSNMLDGIPVRLGVNPDEWRRHRKPGDRVIYTGKIDDYFDCVHGPLPYRSLRFEHEWSPDRLPHPVINQCNRLPYTRIYDHAWFSGETPPHTLVTREYPLAHEAGNDPYYPVPFGDGMAIYQKYRALATAEMGTVFLGRLATYSYLDMWMAVAQAFSKLRPFLPMQQTTKNP